MDPVTKAPAGTEAPAGSHTPSTEASRLPQEEDPSSVLVMAAPGLIHDALEFYTTELDTPELFVDLSSDKSVEMTIDDATWPARLASLRS